MAAVLFLRRCSQRVAAPQFHLPFRTIQTSKPSKQSMSTFWAWTTRAGVTFPSPRYSVAWTQEALLRCGVFAVTGTTALVFMRPVVRVITNEPEGSLINGPWTYRLTSLLLLSPVYAAVLCLVGTAAGRHVYFARMASKIWGRFLPKTQRDRVLCEAGQKKAAETKSAQKNLAHLTPSERRLLQSKQKA